MRRVVSGGDDLIKKNSGAEHEQTKLFQGPHWSYLCLEAEVPEIGDYKTSFIGETSIIVPRDKDGEL